MKSMEAVRVGMPAHSSKGDLISTAMEAETWAAVEDRDDGPGLIDALWRYKLGVILAVLLGALSGYGLAQLQPVLYNARTDVFLEDPRISGVFEQNTRVEFERYVRNAAGIARTRQVGERAAGLLGGRIAVDDLLDQYAVDAKLDQDVFTITATDSSPEGAAEFADAVAGAYRQQVREESQTQSQAIIEKLQAQLVPLNAELQVLNAELEEEGPQFPQQEAARNSLIARIGLNEQRISELQLASDTFDDGVRQVDFAEVPGSPAQPQPVRTAVAAAALTFAAAAALALWRNARAQTAGQRQDPARVLRAPLLGEVPSFEAVGVTGSIPAATAPMSRAGEAYQFIIAALSFALEEGGGNSVLITSAAPGDGKSVTALNLAVAASRDERRVVMVDADARVKGLTTLCNVELDCGLTNLRSDSVPVEWAAARVELPGDVSLPLVPAGDGVSDYAGFFRTSGFRKAIGRVKGWADLVIVDSPPLLAVAETSAIAGQVDGIVLVVTRGTRMRVLEEVADRLHFIGTPLLGYVFNRGDDKASSYGGYGGYGTYGEPQTGRRGRKRVLVSAPANGQPTS